MAVVAGRSTGSLAIMRNTVVSLLAFAMASASLPAAADVCPSAPAPWTVTKRPGPDFDVCYYRAEGRTGFFGIYVGFHPSFRPPPTAKGIAGSVGGKPVEWFAKQPPASAPQFAQEALVFQSPGEKGDRPMAHVWIYGATAEELEVVRGAAAQVQW